MAFFNIDYRKILIMLFLVVIPLISANLTNDDEPGHWALAPISLVGHGIQRTYFKLSSDVRGTTQTYLNLVGIKKENKKLVQTNQELRTQLGALTELQLENKRLNELFIFKKKSNMKLLASKVIASNLTPDQNALIIDKGYSHGVKKYMAAITPGGVVGYVSESYPKTAKILLLTDRYMVIDSIIQRSRSRALLEGHSKNLCQLRNIDSDNSNIQIGDKIVTSGLHKIFPKGFPIGQVVDIKKGSQNTLKQVLIKPAIDPYKTEELFIILNTNKEDLEPEKITEEQNLPLTKEIQIEQTEIDEDSKNNDEDVEL